MRVDVPHLRLIDEATAGDFDALAGSMLAGEKPQILRGFTLSTAGVTQASRLTMRVAGGLLIHPLASDSGSVYAVPADEADESLGPTNSRVEGAFAPSQVNYVGLDLVLEADATTTDLVMIMSEATLQDESSRIPLGRTMQRRIVITTIDPTSTPNVAPIAKVTTDASNNIVTVVDTRQRMFRLGSGGAVPDALHAFPWAAGRTDATGFGTEVGDKQLGCLKDAFDALATRVWESSGGERWFSPTADRNITVTGLGSVFFSTGEFLEWDGSDLHWQGLAILFDNSTGRVNEISDQSTDEPGLTDLADGECVYVDVDRSQNLTGGAALVATKAPLSSLGTGTIPGSRVIFAWRRGAEAYYRGKLGPVGALALPPASTSTLGSVLISGTAPVPSSPVAAALNAAGRAMAGGLTRDGATIGNGIVAIAPDGTADTAVTYGSATMTGAHTFDGLPGGGSNVVMRNNTDSNGTPATIGFKVIQKHSGTDKTAFYVDGAGGVVQPLAFSTPPTPASGYVVEFYQLNGLSSPNSRIQKCVMYSTGQIQVLAESDAS